MKKVELTLSTAYVPDWTVSNAVRELFQNALDQERENASNVASWHYKPGSNGVLTIAIKLAVFPCSRCCLAHLASGQMTLLWVSSVKGTSWLAWCC